jgi:hypothetical protein
VGDPHPTYLFLPLMIIESIGWLVDCLFVVHFVDQYPYGVWFLGQSMYETFTYDNVHVCALWSFAGMLVKKK